MPKDTKKESKPSAKVGLDGLTKSQRFYVKRADEKKRKIEQELDEEEEDTDAPEETKLGQWRRTILEATKRSQNEPLPDKSHFPDYFPWMDPDHLTYCVDKTLDSRLMRRMPDFFLGMPLDREKEYQAAIDKVVGPVNQVARPQMFDEMEQLYRIKRNVVAWSSGWNGSANWDSGLDDSFKRAVENNRVERWRAEVSHHTYIGRQLLAQMQVFDHRLPREEWKIRELWRLRLELAEVLIRGLTILELKNSILPSLTTIRYRDMDSAEESQSGGTTDEDIDDATGEDVKCLWGPRSAQKLKMRTAQTGMWMRINDPMEWTDQETEDGIRDEYEESD
ncbi:hypothetical protein H0H92_000379 [Tricholoma furcatifolium]|nr:hypothetical protein H0H92_000379 [Tricholoma furcatifolium]